jgi:ribonuclease BN (tRNA processing enzyme)
LERSQPAQLIEIGDQSFVVDCGEGVTTQLLRAGRNVAEVQKIFLTHLHWDHILGYAGLVWGGWSAGRPTLEVWGPPGTKKMHEVLFGILYKDDVDWSSGIGYARSGIDSIRINEIGEGLVYERDGVKIIAAAVKHTVLTYAYRFEYADKRIVFSGDTATCDALVKCAKGADLLVQDRIFAKESRRGRRFLCYQIALPLITQERGWLFDRFMIEFLQHHGLPDRARAPTCREETPISLPRGRPDR